MGRIIAVALLLALAGAAQAKDLKPRDLKAGALTLTGLQLRATAPGVPTGAAYLTIANGGKTPDKLLSVDCACADAAMMHRSETRNGVSSMSMVDAVAIPAGGKVEFKPDRLHVMLVGLKKPLKAGATQTLILRFEKAGTVKAPFAVKDVIAP